MEVDDDDDADDCGGDDDEDDDEDVSTTTSRRGGGTGGAGFGAGFETPLPPPPPNKLSKAFFCALKLFSLLFVLVFAAALDAACLTVGAEFAACATVGFAIGLTLVDVVAYGLCWCVAIKSSIGAF